MQLRETLAYQEIRIQMLEKQVNLFIFAQAICHIADIDQTASRSMCFWCLQISEQQKENEKLWAAINRSKPQETQQDSNQNHHSDRMPGEGGGGGGGGRRGGFANHGDRFAGASV